MEGNQMKMREALETMINLFDQGVICTSYANSAEEMEQIEELYRQAKAALSAPTRNFDIGTAEERYKRWRAFCDSYYDCTECPCSEHPYCFPEWEQMPYAPDTKKEERNDAE